MDQAARQRKAAHKQRKAKGRAEAAAQLKAHRSWLDDLKATSRRRASFADALMMGQAAQMAAVAAILPKVSR